MRGASPVNHDGAWGPGAVEEDGAVKAAGQVGIYKARELATRGEVTLRRVRLYVEEKLLPPPLARGNGRVYTEQHLVKLRAIRALRQKGMLLKDIQTRLRSASTEELVAIGGASPAAAGTGTAEAGATASGTAEETAARSLGQRWQRIELLPGMELHVRADAGPLLARLAQEIHARYAVKT